MHLQHVIYHLDDAPQRWYALALTTRWCIASCTCAPTLCFMHATPQSKRATVVWAERGAPHAHAPCLGKQPRPSSWGSSAPPATAAPAWLSTAACSDLPQHHHVGKHIQPWRTHHRLPGVTAGLRRGCTQTALAAGVRLRFAARPLRRPAHKHTHIPRQDVVRQATRALARAAARQLKAFY